MSAMPPMLLVIALGSAATDLPPLLARAFANMANDLVCDFTRTRQKGDETRIERFDETGGPQGWTLVAIDGDEPSARQLKKYARSADERAERQHPARVELADLAEPGSYRLLDEDARQAVYEFKPLAEDEDDEKVVAALVGQMTIDKSTPHVAAFEMNNVEPFSPAPMVTIHAMRQRVEFASLPAPEAVVSRRIEIDVEGRVMGFKKINDHQVVTFDDFECR